MDNANYEDPIVWNITTIINYIQAHFIQILLFILVFVIIYVVDYIANINIMLYGMPNVPIIGINGSHTQVKMLNRHKKIKK